MPFGFAVIEPTAGRVDASGRLIAADAALLRLQQAAGGDLGDPLLVPALARLVSLSQSLNICIARQVLIADDDGPQDVAAEARPDDGGIALNLGDRSRRTRSSSSAMVGAPSSGDQDGVTDGYVPRFSISFDTGLRLTAPVPDLGAVVGDPVLDLLTLVENDLGDMPFLVGLAQRAPTHGQRVSLKQVPGVDYVLSVRPDLDADGAFAGYIADIERVTPPDAIAALPPDLRFSERLDRALRAPLGRIAATADAIREQADGPLRRDYADYASDIGSAARHLLTLADDLGDLEAIERPDYQPDVETLDLADLVRRAAGLLRVRASDRQVRLDYPAVGEVLEGRGEFRRVLQILVNLIGNAVRYSPEGSMIWLRTERDEDTAVIIVADQGKGIAIDDQERIFEKFERVDAREPGGSGLGLYIARKLARAMGGDVMVDSAPGQGARFILTLPIS